MFTAVLLAARLAGLVADSTIAFVGATLIDGNGGPPVPNSVVTVTGQKIMAAGPRDLVKLPAGARVIDAHGKFLTPGFIDIVIEAAQINRKHGLTTVRDS